MANGLVPDIGLQLGRGLQNFSQLQNMQLQRQQIQQQLAAQKAEQQRQAQLQGLLGQIQGGQGIAPGSPSTEGGPSLDIAPGQAAAASPSARGRLTSTQAMAQLAIQFPDRFKAVNKNLGLITQRQKDEAADFAFRLKNTPFQNREALISSRIANLQAQGRNATDTQSLIGMDEQSQNEALDVVQIAALPVEDRIELARGGSVDPVQSSQILGDGTTVQVRRSGATAVTDPQGNPVTGKKRQDVIAEARRQEAAQQAARAGGRAQAVSDVKVAETLTLEDVSAEARQQIELDKIKIDESKIKNEQDRQAAIDTKNVRRSEANNAVSLVNGLLNDDRFSAAFGRVVTQIPEQLRPQSTIDARAEVDQVISLLSLESRNKLKGQGTITDSEAKTLEKSATTLANPLLSDESVRKELRRVRDVFEDAAARNQLNRSTRDQAITQQSQQQEVIRFTREGVRVQ